MLSILLMVVMPIILAPRTVEIPNPPTLHQSASVVDSKAMPEVHLKQDSRLTQPLTVVAKRISTEAFAEKIALLSGVPIKFDRFYTGRNLQMCVRNRSCADVMTGVSTLFKGEWRLDGEGYTLYPKQSTVLYQRYWWDLFNSERSKALAAVAQSYVAAMGESNPLTTHTQDQGKKSTVAVGGEILSEKTFWENLPLPLKQRVAGSFNDSFSYRRFPMPTPSSAEGGISVPLSQLPDESKNVLFRFFTALNEGQSPSSIRAVCFVNGDTQFDVEALLNNGTRTASGVNLQNTTVLRTASLFVDHRFVKTPPPESGVKLSTAWRQMLDYQHKTVWNNDVPTGTIPEVLPARLPDMLQWLADKTDHEFIADYYSMPARLMTDDERRRIPAPNIDLEWNQIAATYDVSWKEIAPRLTLIASNRWYREDLLDAPQDRVEKLTQAAASILHEEPTLPLNKVSLSLYQHLEIASLTLSNFTRWQIANGLTFYVDEDILSASEKQNDKRLLMESNCQPYSDICATCLNYPLTCRFFALLSPTDRTALLNDGISISRLNPSQREAAAKITPDVAAAVYAVGNEESRLKLSFAAMTFRTRSSLTFGNREQGHLPYLLELVAVQK